EQPSNARRFFGPWAGYIGSRLTNYLPRTRGTPAVMVSLIFHTSLLLLLALLSLTGPGGTIRSFDFNASTADIEGVDAATPLLMSEGDAPPPADVEDESLEPPAPKPTNTASTLAELLNDRALPNN